MMLEKNKLHSKPIGDSAGAARMARPKSHTGVASYSESSLWCYRDTSTERYFRQGLSRHSSQRRQKFLTAIVADLAGGCSVKIKA